MNTDPKCKTCGDVGTLNDADPGDTYFNTWPCPDCKTAPPQKPQCKTCHGLGKLNDAEPGDIGFNEWTCPDCEKSNEPKQLKKSLPVIKSLHLQHYEYLSSPLLVP